MGFFSVDCAQNRWPPQRVLPTSHNCCRVPSGGGTFLLKNLLQKHSPKQVSLVSYCFPWWGTTQMHLLEISHNGIHKDSHSCRYPLGNLALDHLWAWEKEDQGAYLLGNNRNCWLGFVSWSFGVNHYSAKSWMMLLVAFLHRQCPHGSPTNGLLSGTISSIEPTWAPYY